jgi:heme exporter protein C
MSSLVLQFKSPKAIVMSLAVLIVAIILVAWFSPADKTLGDLVKLVYVHGAIVQVALLTFGVAGVLGLGYLTFGRAALYEWSQAAERTGIVLWVLYVVTSATVMKLAWGGIAWSEPRWVLGIQVMVVAPVVHLGGSLMQNRRITALLNAAVAGLILFLLYRARVVLHPLDPIGTSPSTAIKVSYDVLLVLWVLVAAQMAHVFHVSTLEQETTCSPI